MFTYCAISSIFNFSLKFSFNKEIACAIWLERVPFVLINLMPVISGRYWNMVHGATLEEVKRDEEGIRKSILTSSIFYFS